MRKMQSTLQRLHLAHKKEVQVFFMFVEKTAREKHKSKLNFKQIVLLIQKKLTEVWNDVRKWIIERFKITNKLFYLL